MGTPRPGRNWFLLAGRLLSIVVAGLAHLLILPLPDFHKLKGTSAVVCRLQLKHFRITSAAPQKLVVRALLGDSAIFQNQDAV